MKGSKARLRNVINVKIEKYGEHVTVHNVLMTDYDWDMYKFKLEVKGIAYSERHTLWIYATNTEI